MKRIIVIILIVSALLNLTKSNSISFSEYSIQLVSVSSEGEQANGCSGNPAISPEGRYVAFQSFASNLVPNDDNDALDLFLRDLGEQTTIRISEGIYNGYSCGIGGRISISSDANFIAFVSFSPDLVQNDNNEELDIFVLDRVNNTVERVSIKSDGTEAPEGAGNPSITNDGRYVTFISNYLTSDDTSSFWELYIHDRLTHQTTRPINAAWGEVPDNGITSSMISKDGSAIAFTSSATNIVLGDSNNKSDVFVYNIASMITKRVSVNNIGVQTNEDGSLPSISDDGKIIVFESMATNLVTPDTNNRLDIFIYDMVNNEISRLTNSPSGQEADGNSYQPKVSGNGQYVVFESGATNLILDDTNDYCGAGPLQNCQDIFLYDCAKEDISRVSIAHDSSESNGDSSQSAISKDGKTILFSSFAFNLVENDINYQDDIFAFMLPPQHEFFLPIIYKQ